MERPPPPFFRQGPSANVRLAVFSIVAIILIVVDARSHVLEPVRQAVGTALYPVQRILLWPRDTLLTLRDYTTDVARLRAENTELRRIEAINSRTLAQAEQLAAENARLRRLVDMRERLAIPSAVAEVLYETRDPFVRHLMLDKGLRHGVLPGQPVIDAAGVIGQITRVTEFGSEATLLTDQQSTIPVSVRRTGQRAIAFGGPDPGQLELRYLPANADLRQGDLLETSGLDGLYPPGLPVGRVIRFGPQVPGPFSHALIEPAAAVERSRLLLILLLDRSVLPEIPEGLAADTRGPRSHP